MDIFISCDWGTTSFRLRLIDAATQKIVAEANTQQGIAATYELWQAEQGTERLLFYSNYINSQVQLLEATSAIKLSNVPVIISGMASSSIGMKELPYKKIPFELKPGNLLSDFIKSTPLFQHDIVLISGACSANDVMRGEETILAGCNVNAACKKHLFILPGTHSKHAIVENEILTGINTYMTGELFQLLSTKSILSNSVEKNETAEPYEIFIKGVKDASTSSLLNNIFHVRTNTLFDTINKKDNYDYLSGLLIGEELKQLLHKDFDAVTILSSGNLAALYHAALTTMNIGVPVSVADAGKAIINAHTTLYKQRY